MGMNMRRLQLLLIDSLICVASFLMLAVYLSLNVESIQVNESYTVLKCLCMYGFVMGARFISGVYRNIWRYAKVNVYLKLILADTAGTLLYIIVARFIYTINLGVTCALLSYMCIILLTLMSRFVYQTLYAYNGQRADLQRLYECEQKHYKINIAIVGAGNVGASLADELVRNPKSYYSPYCFIDNDKNKIGSDINGLPIYPEDEKVVERIKRLPVQEIVIALPDAAPEEKTRLYNLYKETDCRVKIYDYALSHDGNVSGKKSLRTFQVEDLLFRKAHSVISEQSKAYYRNKTILVTGCGSIGSELCRQIARLGPKKLVMLDIYENNAYEIQQELVRLYGGQLEMETVIASVRDVRRLDEVFRQHRPDVIFHAAAHKHVPLMEHSPCEAIKNNVLGTKNVADMAEKYGAEKFLLISTDKAVNPTNVMGASKRLCEMVIQCRKDSTCAFTAVRFGNVLGSNGSVIPLFQKQIEEGGPVTLTDKRIVRYFMTIPEAVGLVMEAGAMAKDGELFVLNMGKPVKILDLAENMIRLTGLKPYQDIDIVEVGLRPGEKLYEELLMKSLDLDKTSHEMIYIERDVELTRDEVDRKLEIVRLAAESQSNEQVMEAIRQVVPTYRAPEDVNNCVPI